MSNVTVSQLADVLGVSIERLLDQLTTAGIVASGGDDPVSNDDKKKLLAYLRASHGKSDNDATAPRKVTLKRKSTSELRISGSGPRASTKTVNVEFRKSRTYVKREALQEQNSLDPDREKAVEALKEAQALREAEDTVRKDADEKAAREAEEGAKLAAEEQARKSEEDASRREIEEKARHATAQKEAEESERKKEEERAKKLAEEQRKRKKQRNKPSTRYGRAELHVAGGAAGRRLKPARRATKHRARSR